LQEKLKRKNKMTLNNEQVRVIQTLYGQSEKFRTTVNQLVQSEAAAVSKQAELLGKFAAESVSEGAKPDVPKKATKPVKSGPKKNENGTEKRGPGRPRKVVEGSGDEVPKTTHKDAISQVLKNASAPLSSSEILEALNSANLSNYKMPKSPVLFTVLSIMRNEKILTVSGKRPHLRYTLAA
jgi:hypothetical protein